MGGLRTSITNIIGEIHQFFVKEHSYQEKKSPQTFLLNVLNSHVFFRKILGPGHKLQNVLPKTNRNGPFGGDHVSPSTQAIRNVHKRRQSRWSRHLLHRLGGRKIKGHKKRHATQMCQHLEDQRSSILKHKESKTSQS